MCMRLKLSNDTYMMWKLLLCLKLNNDTYMWKQLMWLKLHNDTCIWKLVLRLQIKLTQWVSFFFSGLGSRALSLV